MFNFMKFERRGILYAEKVNKSHAARASKWSVIGDIGDRVRTGGLGGSLRELVRGRRAQKRTKSAGSFGGPKPYIFKLEPQGASTSRISQHQDLTHLEAPIFTFQRDSRCKPEVVGFTKITRGNWAGAALNRSLFTNYSSYFFTLQLYSFFLTNHFFFKIRPLPKNLKLMGWKAKHSTPDPFDERGPTVHNLVIIFKHNKLTIVLTDHNKRCYFYLQTGLLLKFFRHKKSIKKTKTAKVLLFKYLRKLLNLMMIRTLSLYVRGSPKNFPELIRVLRKPFTHTYTNPFTKLQVDETTVQSPHFPRFKFIQLFFVKLTPFGKMKTKPRGRLKRRIRKKIVKMNNIPD